MPNEIDDLSEMGSIRLEDIAKTTKRIPFKDSEIEFAITLIKKNQARGLQTTIHPDFTSDARAYIEEGMFFISLEDADTDILFVKEDAGKGLLGGQKSVFSFYLGNVYRDTFTPGGTKKKLEYSNHIHK
mgnify:CR=1 FL=1